MSTKFHQVTITGLVMSHPESLPPDQWPLETLIEDLLEFEQSINVSSMELQPKPEKRVYTCSICGGRHSSRFCPHKNKGGEE